jgi:hypothetical protein
MAAEYVDILQPSFSKTNRFIIQAPTLEKLSTQIMSPGKHETRCTKKVGFRLQIKMWMATDRGTMFVIKI